MTGNRRIALNIIATYGRSLYALAIGLFCGRWTLMALGEVDYGLVGVVGGLTAFLLFVNGLMSSAISRFYAFSVGRASISGNRAPGVEECRRWFSIALGLHTAVPALLTAAGYPAGVWAVENFLSIPPGRVADCIWVWRFTCIGAFVSMVNVPFAAMYNAKQEIAELTVYSFVTTTLNAGFMYYLVTHQGVWLVAYAGWTCLLTVAPQLVIMCRAILKYPECRFRIAYLFDRARIMQVLGFAGSRFICALSTLASGQGLAIVVNKYLGPARNAAMSIGHGIVAHSSTLSTALSGAFSPAIVNVAGAGDLETMRRMIFRACRFSVASILVFALPVMLEINSVTVLWLKTPPEGTSVIAVFMLVDLVMSRLSEGHYIGMMALGKIFKFQLCESVFFFLRLAIGWILVALGWDLWAVGIAYVSTGVFSVLLKLLFGRAVCGLSVRRWFRQVLCPLSAAAFAALSAGAAVVFSMEASLPRIVLTAVSTETVLLPFLWFAVLAESERAQIRSKLRAVAIRLAGGRR